MKKILFCTIAILSLSLAIHAQGVFKLVRKDGGPSGFLNISQKTDAQGNTVMICTGSGNDKSGFMAPPNTANPVDYNKVITYVNEQIKKGNFSGNAQVEGQHVDWKGSDVYNYNMTATSPKKK